MTRVSAPQGRAPLACAAAVALGSFLIFLVQPIAARTLLPAFGGSGSVWVVSLAFYQLVLAVGTLLAHLLRTRTSLRTQAIVLIALAATAFLLFRASLPLQPVDVWIDRPALRLLLSLAASIGLPFLTLALAGPLVQSWSVASSGQPSSGLGGGGIYSLYALSNAASLVALASYSTLFEPRWGIHLQGRLWGWLFAIEVVLIVGLAWRAHGFARPGQRSGQPSEVQDAATTGDPSDRGSVLGWGVRAATGVMVLTCTSALIGQDIAAIPLLWIIPLILYLLTWVVAFWDKVRLGATTRSILVLVSLVAIVLAVDPSAQLALKTRLASALTALTLACLAIHAALYRTRPAPIHLTRYYCTLATGGAIGGLLAGVVAVLVLDDWRDVGVAYALAGLLAGADLWIAARGTGVGRTGKLLRLGQIGLLVVPCVHLFVVTGMDLPGLVYKHRDFHGLVRVVELDADRPARHRLALYHGTTLHGSQRLDPERRAEPTSYYGTATGVGLATRMLQARFGPERGVRFGVVGLGVGSLAAYVRPHDAMRFYELSPTVAALATDPSATGDPRRGFTLLDEAAGPVQVVIGDARLSLAAELEARPRGNGFDLLVLDAFAGDAVPMHLLTREAFDLYRRHLSADGIILAHVSSDWIDLVPLLYALAEAEGWEALTISNRASPDGIGSANSVWVVMMRDNSLLRGLAEQCTPLMDSGDIMVQNRRNVTWGNLQPWTDERGDLLTLMRSHIQARRR